MIAIDDQNNWKHGGTQPTFVFSIFLSFVFQEMQKWNGTSLYVDFHSTELFFLPKNLSNPIGILNKVLFWLVLGLFRLLLGCSWLVLRLFRLFLACSWVVPVVLGLFWGVPSFSNDDLVIGDEELQAVHKEIFCTDTKVKIFWYALHLQEKQFLPGGYGIFRIWALR